MVKKKATIRRIPSWLRAKTVSGSVEAPMAWLDPILETDKPAIGNVDGSPTNLAANGFQYGPAGDEQPTYREDHWDFTATDNVRWGLQGSGTLDLPEYTAVFAVRMPSDIKDRWFLGHVDDANNANRVVDAHALFRDGNDLIWDVTDSNDNRALSRLDPYDYQDKFLVIGLAYSKSQGASNIWVSENGTVSSDSGSATFNGDFTTTRNLHVIGEPDGVGSPSLSQNIYHFSEWRGYVTDSYMRNTLIPKAEAKLP